MSKRHFDGKLVDVSADSFTIGPNTATTFGGSPVWTNKTDGIVRLNGVSQYTNMKYSYCVINGIQHVRLAGVNPACAIPNTVGPHFVDIDIPDTAVKPYDDTNALTGTPGILNATCAVGIMTNGDSTPAGVFITALSQGSPTIQFSIQAPAAAQNKNLLTNDLYFSFPITH